MVLRAPPPNWEYCLAHVESLLFDRGFVMPPGLDLQSEMRQSMARQPQLGRDDMIGDLNHLPEMIPMGRSSPTDDTEEEDGHYSHDSHAPASWAGSILGTTDEEDFLRSTTDLQDANAKVSGLEFGDQANAKEKNPMSSSRVVGFIGDQFHYMDELSTTDGNPELFPFRILPSYRARILRNRPEIRDLVDFSRDEEEEGQNSSSPDTRPSRAPLVDYCMPPALHMLSMEKMPMGPKKQSKPTKCVLLVTCGEMKNLNMGSEPQHYRRIVLTDYGAKQVGFKDEWIWGGYIWGSDMLVVHLDFENGHIHFGPHRQQLSAPVILSIATALGYPATTFLWSAIVIFGGRNDCLWLTDTAPHEIVDRYGTEVKNVETARAAVFDKGLGWLQGHLKSLGHAELEVGYIGGGMCHGTTAQPLLPQQDVTHLRPGDAPTLLRTLFLEPAMERNQKYEDNPAFREIICAPISMDDEVWKERFSKDPHGLRLPVCLDLVRGVANATYQVLSKVRPRFLRLHYFLCAGEPERNLRCTGRPDYAYTKATFPFEPHHHFDQKCHFHHLTYGTGPRGDEMFKRRLVDGPHLVSKN
jgi:hypothetical protein